MAGIQIDGVNNKIDFDDDADTSISSSTDDTLVVEVGGNTLATVTSTSVTINDGTTIITNDNSDTLTLQSADDDASEGPVMVFDRASSSPADDDVLGAINFRGKDSGGNGVDYVKIQAEIMQEADGSEDGQLQFNLQKAGTSRNILTLDRVAAVINEDSQDIDFRVESDSNTHMLFVDAGSNHVSINEFDGGGEFNVKSVSQTGVVVESNSASIGQYIGKNNSASNDTQIMILQSARNSTAHFEFGRFKSNDGSDLEMLFDGAGAIKIDGVVTTGGIDYAEYFEWKDGNSSSEDRRGHSVITDGNKIVVATSSDDASKIIGIVSTNPTVLGDADLERWMFKYERDDYGSLVWEEHTVTEWTDEDGKDHSYDTDRIPSDLTAPSDATVISEEKDRYGNTIKLKRKKLNSDWDSSQQYISREDRKEWEAIGLVGKLRLKKGEPVNPNWIKLRDISDSVEEWLVR
jgi:hypothetical protein